MAVLILPFTFILLPCFPVKLGNRRFHPTSYANTTPSVKMACSGQWLKQAQQAWQLSALMMGVVLALVTVGIVWLIF